MALFPITASLVNISTVAPIATDNFVGAILRDAANYAVRGALTGGTQSANGLRFTNLGQLLYNDASAGLPANTQWADGLPLASDGSLCVALAAPVTWSNGMPFAANGAVAASVI